MSLLLAIALTLSTHAADAEALQARLAAAEAAYEAASAGLASGLGDAEAVYRWSARWAEAERAAPTSAAGAPAAHLARMEVLQATVVQRYEVGAASAAEVTAAAWYVADARCQVSD